MPKKQLKVKRAPTKQQLSRRQKERKIQRITLYSGISLIALVVLFIAFGFYIREIRPLNKPAIKINDTVISSDYYIDILKLFVQTDNPLAKANVADYAVSFIQNNELIRQEALKPGNEISPQEINEALSKSTLPINRERARDFIIADLYAKKIRDKLAEDIPTRSDHAHLQLILLDKKESADEAMNRLKKGEEFATLAKQFSIDFGSKENGGDLGLQPKEFIADYISDVVFKMQPGSITDLINPQGTSLFYIVKVIDIQKNSEINTENREKLLSQALSKWIAALKEKSTIEVYLNEKDKLRALELSRKS